MKEILQLGVLKLSLETCIRDRSLRILVYDEGTVS